MASIYKNVTLSDSDDSNEDTSTSRGLGHNSSTRRGNTKEEQLYGIWAPTSLPPAQPVRKRKKGGLASSFVSSGKIASTRDTNDESIVIAPTKPHTTTDELSTTTAQTSQASRAVFDRDFGTFERHTKGFGMKMLAQMGFDERRWKGIVNPVTAKQRPEGAGIGAHGFQELTERDAKLLGKEKKEEVEEKKPMKVKRETWKKKKVKKPKVIYKTVADITKEQHKNGDNAMSDSAALRSHQQQQEPMMVVDMRGPNVKINALGDLNSSSSSSSNIATRHVTDSLDTHLPELHHNLRLLVDLTEQEVNMKEQSRLREERTMNALQDDVSKLQIALNESSRIISALQSTQTQIRACQAQLLQGKETLLIEDKLSIVMEMMVKLQESFPQEYIAYHLGACCVPLAFPLLKARLERWQPFSEQQEEEDRMYMLLRRWYELLDGSFDTHGQDLWRVCVVNVLLHPLRLLLSSASAGGTVEKEGKEFGYGGLTRRVIVLLKAMKRLISSDFYELLLKETVIPTLRQTLLKWTATQTEQTALVMSALFPWCKMLSIENTVALRDSLTFKISQFINLTWQIHDLDSHDMVIKMLSLQQAWCSSAPSTSSATSHTRLVTKNVLPKLVSFVREMSWLDLNCIEDVQLCMKIVLSTSWQSILSRESWRHIVLYEMTPLWLKQMFKVTTTRTLAAAFHVYMSWRVSGLYDEHTLSRLPTLRRVLSLVVKWFQPPNNNNTKQYQEECYQIAQNLLLHHTPSHDSNSSRGVQSSLKRKLSATKRRLVKTFKEQIEDVASHVGLLMINTDDVAPHGQTIYLLGSLRVYLGHKVIFVLQPNQRWIPQGLRHILEQATAAV